MKIPFIGPEFVRDTLEFPALINAIRKALSGEIAVPNRSHFTMSADGHSDATLLLMPAWRLTEPAFVGVKIATVFPDNGTKNVPAVYASYLLNDGRTGRPLALIDGSQITCRRTAAVSALAASYLTSAQPKRLLVLGAGRVGSLLPEAYISQFPIEDISIWSRNVGSANALVSSLSARGIKARVVKTVEEGCLDADIVSSATLARSPIISGKWLKSSTHLDLIGSFTPDMREADDECFVNSRVVVDTQAAIVESGDLIFPINHGLVDPANILTLTDVIRGTYRSERRSVFKAVGTALSDFASAMLIYERYLASEAPSRV